MIGGTLFPYKTCHKVTWISPTGDTENQIDHIAISRRWRSSLQDVRKKRGADITSDHHRLVAKIQLKFLSTKRPGIRCRKFNVQFFKDPKVIRNYQISLQNKFEVLQNMNDSDTDVNTAWELTRDSIIKSCKDTVGFVQLNRKKWMSEETWQKVNHRHKLKEKGLNATTRQHPKKKGNQYHKTGTRMESPGTPKTGNTKEHLAQRTTHRTKNNWKYLELGKNPVTTERSGKKL